MRHPAKYNDALFPIFSTRLGTANCSNVLDPFAGTGKIFELQRWLPEIRIFGTELEYEWASMTKGMMVANALRLPFDNDTFDAICTSPCYGNRMADHHNAQDASLRNTYTHALGHPLHKNNAGAMQWGYEYRRFHFDAWREVQRVHRKGGLFILNIKDHIRRGEIQYVTNWHVNVLKMFGYMFLEEVHIPLNGNRFGQNGNVRIDYESVVLFKLEDK